MNNKIPPEKEEEILEEVFSNQEWQDKEIVDLKYSAMELKGALELAISLSFQAGQKQEREDVAQFIKDLKEFIKKNSGCEYGRIFDFIDKLAGDFENDRT